MGDLLNFESFGQDNVASGCSSGQPRDATAHLVFESSPSFYNNALAVTLLVPCPRTDAHPKALSTQHVTRIATSFGHRKESCVAPSTHFRPALQRMTNPAETLESADEDLRHGCLPYNRFGSGHRNDCGRPAFTRAFPFTRARSWPCSNPA